MPTQTVRMYFVSFCTWAQERAVTRPHPRMMLIRSGSDIHPSRRRWGVGFCSMHEAHQAAPPLPPLRITLCIPPPLPNF